MVFLAGQDVLERGEPVGVDDHQRVGPRGVEPFAQTAEAGDESRVRATAQAHALLLGEHDRRLMPDDRRADDLTHRRSSWIEARQDRVDQ